MLAFAAHTLKLERYREEWPLRKDDTQICEAFHIFWCWESWDSHT